MIKVHKILKFGDPIEKLVETWHTDVTTHLLLLGLLRVHLLRTSTATGLLLVRVHVFTI